MRLFLRSLMGWLGLVLLSTQMIFAQSDMGTVFGKVLTADKEVVEYATVQLKGTSHGTVTHKGGKYSLSAPAGKYILTVSMLGYKPMEHHIFLKANESIQQNVTIESQSESLDEVVVLSNGVSRMKRSAYNAVAVDTKILHNSTQSLSEALAQAPGMKIRESGGVGSDMQLTMDGFTGKHIKVFIDGVPQEGVGNSFSLNNIPVNYAERIEVYKGVVPVEFGTDAIGGVINVVTRKSENRWFLDASYSYGSFNTHKSYVNFGQSFKNGLTYEINAFQNYSDNNYYVDTPVKDFQTGAINKRLIERVKRFHDTYHNEVVVGKVGVVNKPWADRMFFSLTYSQFYKEIQTGVRQEVVFGGKYRKGNSFMPSLEYSKRDLLLKGLDLFLNASYNQNRTENVDTSAYEFNWRGESRLMRLPGEQSYQHTESSNNNWNATVTANYRITARQVLTLNHVMNYFERNNRSLLGAGSMANAIDKDTHKNITGLSYRYMANERWNLSLFGKHYSQKIAGPMATSAAQDEYVRVTNSIRAVGYGAAGTYFILPSLQAKLSYEKAYRLPTIDEMFGDEDLETGDLSLKPESSDNINLALSFNHSWGKHNLYAEGSFIYRNTQDYIQRTIVDLSGGKSGATYVNHGKVKSKGGNLALHYNYGRWLSVGGNFTLMDIRDNVRTVAGSNQESLTYQARMPNVPYQFANSFASFYLNDLGAKGNKLTIGYDNNYMHAFPLYSEALGSESSFVVPTQFAHNLSLTYAFCQNRYTFSLECQNVTDEKLYDNFTLQKAGRAFYGKVRVNLGEGRGKGNKRKQ
ncbi:MAG: TonB-dependent receptor domain-containing protein [Phocaeicola sp.]